MGWWGFNVMEGDPPMDMECVINEQLSGTNPHEEPVDTDEDYDRLYKQQRDLVVARLKSGDYGAVIQAIRDEEGDFGEYEWTISLQVLGEMVMCYGGAMSDRDKETFIDAAECDEWASYNNDRKAAMDAYIERVKSYEGVAIEPISRGLLAALQDHIEKDEPGLVNK